MCVTFLELVFLPLHCGNNLNSLVFLLTQDESWEGLVLVHPGVCVPGGRGRAQVSTVKLHRDGYPLGSVTWPEA